MEDLYKDDPNSWLRRTCFSKTVYHQPDPSQIPIIPLTKLKLGSSNPSSNPASISVTWDNTSKTTQTTTLSSLKSNNPDSGLTAEMQVESHSKTEKNNMSSMHGVISGMFKELKKTVMSRFMGPLHREKTVKSSLTQKKKGWDEKSSEDDWCQS